MAEHAPARNRIFLIMAIMSAVFLIITVKLVDYQVIHRPQFVEFADEEHKVKVPMEIPARRGSIYDRNGFLLATDVQLYNISASPGYMSPDQPAAAAEYLSPLLGIDQADLEKRLTAGDGYVDIIHDVPTLTGEQIRDKHLNGINANAYLRRVYPAGTLASHIIGFLNFDRVPNYGVELYYGEVLSGSAGTCQGIRDRYDNVVPIQDVDYQPPHNGKNLYLTIDRTAQYVVETALAQALKDSGAESGTVVVMHPRTGAILAMASLPNYNPNAFSDAFVEDPSVFNNPAISDQYEPGSVFKIFTLAAALDAGVITPDSTVTDFGQVEVGGQTILNSDRQAHGTVDMVTVLGKSLNVGSAQVAVHLRKDQFYTYMRKFGFGSKTDVDLVGEIAGRLKTPEDADWYESDLGTNSFGQGVATTPLQVAAAVAAVANDGFLMKPYIVQRTEMAEDGWLGWRADEPQPVGEKVRYAQPQMMRPVITPETAHTMTQMMVQAVEHETTMAQVPGYRVAGKSGTSQIPIPGGYDLEDTIASFAGYLPADDPALVILVIINRPQSSTWGGIVAAPVFASIAQQLVTIFDIPPDDVRHQLASQQVGIMVQ